MKDDKQLDPAVQALETTLRWVKLLENSSASVITDLARYATAKNVDLRDVEMGKVALQHIINNLKKVDKPD